MPIESILESAETLLHRKPGNSEWLPLNLRSEFKLQNPGEEFDKGKLDEGIAKLVGENRSYLSDVLSTSLQLPNLSFFAGSGTSLGEVKGPSMWDLWCKSMCTQEDPEIKDENRLSKEATNICEKVKYNERDNPNIEHFLSHCEAFLSFNDDKVVHDFVLQVKKIIIKECSEFVFKKESDRSAYNILLQKLARRRVRDPRLKIFTTNYDLCFEKAAAEQGMVVVDGFSYTQPRRFDARFFSYDIVNRDEHINNEFIEGVFKLHKLHGSVGWAREEGSIFVSEDVNEENVALIFPAAGKYQQAFIQPHLELLSRFLESLRKPNCCLIIAGFGFNDDHLAEPILSGIKSNPSLKLIIADHSARKHIDNETKDSSKYWGELSSLAIDGYDIHFLNSSFKEFVALIPYLKALTPAEQLIKAAGKIGKQDA